MNAQVIVMAVSSVTAVLALVVGALGLTRSLRNDLRKDAMIQGAKDEILDDIKRRLDLSDGVAEKARSLRQDVDGLKDIAAKTADGLQDHLLECARRQGLLEGKMQNVVEGQERLQRTTEGIQRMIANWMRDGTNPASPVP